MDTKQQILNTAYTLFQQKSYENVSVTDICDACHLTKPAFYYHFSSKGELLIHYYEHAVDQIINEQPEHIDNYWQQLVASFTALMSASTAIGVDLTSQLFITNLGNNQGTFDFDDRFKQVCVSLITAAQKAHQIRNQSAPLQLFIAASMMFTGYNVYWAIRNGDFDRPTNFVASLETVFDIPQANRVTLNDMLSIS